MKKRVLFLFFLLQSSILFAQQKLQHISTEKNCTGNSTYISADGLNGNPNAIIIVEYDAVTAKANPHAVGTWYTGSQWAIFNQDLAPMPVGLTFNLTWKNADANAFVHKVVNGNNILDHSSLNNNPSASFYASQVWNPGGTGGVYNNANISLSYNQQLGRWQVQNQEGAPLPENCAINILIRSGNVENVITNATGIVNTKIKPGQPSGKPSVDIITNGTNILEVLKVKADTLMGNWGFESGLLGWVPSGTAFNTQPTFGNNIKAFRVRYDHTLEGGGLGGDYWRNTPYPVGHKGDYWIGTYENQPDEYTQKENGVFVDEKIGNIQGDGPTGTLTSEPFKLYHENIYFLMGGGSDARNLRVELQVKKTDFPGASASDPVDGDYVILQTKYNLRNTEEMRRQWFTLGPQWMGKTYRIKLVDNASGGWGHINADDFVFTNTNPRNILMEIRGGNTSEWVDKDYPVWGAADTHEHPYLVNAHGGNVVKGNLFGPANTGNLPDNGWPDFQYRPAFDRGDYTKMYQDWIKRAYKGGVRIMSSLAVNNWMFASAFLKRLARGGVGAEGGSFTINGGAWDDNTISGIQIAAIKQWASLPENANWVGVATTPAQARKLILENKLALVLGIEVDILGNFVERDMGDSRAVVLPQDPAEKRTRIGQYLDGLKRQGVVQITPIHYVSEPWGGAAIFNRWFNEQNRLFTGKNVVVETGNPWGIRYRINHDQWGTADASARELITGHSRTIASDHSWDHTHLGHVNSLGITSAGEILLEELAKRGMLIDVEHASYKTANGFFNLARTRLNGYPIMSSHTDMGQLSFTGDGDWQRDNITDFDRENVARFGTSLISNLRHEGQATDEKLRQIRELGGTLGIIMLPYRKYSYLNEAYAYNNNDGSTKTWAQMYLYGINFMDGKNVGFCLDQGFVKSLSPRFGLNSAYTLSMEKTDELKKTKRLEQTRVQGFGVSYSMPVAYNKPQWLRRGFEWHTDWPRFRKPDEAANFSFDGTGKEDMYVDAWIAIHAFKAGRNPWLEGEDKLPESGYPAHNGRIRNYVRGLALARDQFRKVHDDCGILGASCAGAAKHERVAAYCVVNGITPNDLTEFRNDNWVLENYAVLKELWDHWEKMEGSLSGNTSYPMLRSRLGDKEWDYNMDGLAHYGLIPDFFQDLYNIFKERMGAGSNKPAAFIAPLFRSADDYLKMWEKAEVLKNTIRY